MRVYDGGRVRVCDGERMRECDNGSILVGVSIHCVDSCWCYVAKCSE